MAKLVEIAKQLREARHRHEALALTEEEAAFYDALAGDPENWAADPKLVTIARELVQGIRSDLTVGLDVRRIHRSSGPQAHQAAAPPTP